MADWLSAGWLVAGWLAGWLARFLSAELAAWVAARAVAWRADKLAGSLPDWRTGWGRWSTEPLICILNPVRSTQDHARSIYGILLDFYRIRLDLHNILLEFYRIP